MPEIPPFLRDLLDWAYHNGATRDSETVTITAGGLKEIGAVLGYEPRVGKPTTNSTENPPGRDGVTEQKT